MTNTPNLDVLAMIALLCVVLLTCFCFFVRLRCRDRQAIPEAFSIAVLGAISGLVIARVYFATLP